MEVAAKERVVRVRAGVKWGQVLAAAGPLGLTGLSGSAPGVSVTGYTLGGGVGWFSRKYGFASDSVRAIDIVDADGEPGRVTAESDPELFWALRGGGGDFAVVTALELELYPARDSWAFGETIVLTAPIGLEIPPQSGHPGPDSTIPLGGALEE